jgi:indolepyruvate ferredoxin oxidoreductase beta subunit
MPKGTGVINILVTGVGGQGVLVASEVIARVALAAGLTAKKSEVHGMAQRGGAVVSEVRFGREVHSPLIPAGEVHILVAFEELEALRWAHLVRRGMAAVVSRQRIAPLAVSLGKETYPEDPLATLASMGLRVVPVDALPLAVASGSPKVVNTVILGAVSAQLPFPPALWRKVIAASVPPATLAMNLAAFDAGRRAVAP